MDGHYYNDPCYFCLDTPHYNAVVKSTVLRFSLSSNPAAATYLRYKTRDLNCSVPVSSLGT